MSRTTSERIPEPPEALFGRIVSILEQARGNVVRAVNSNMVWAYWLIGREIVEELQGGAERAEYGKQLIDDLSVRLTERYGKGFSWRNLQLFKQFYLSYKDRGEILRPVGTESGQTQIVRPVGAESEDMKKLSPAGRELELAQIAYPSGVELVPVGKSSPAESEIVRGFSPQLSWSHYRVLMRVENVAARDFYEREAIEGGWSKRTLERQLHTQYYGSP